MSFVFFTQSPPVYMHGSGVVIIYFFFFFIKASRQTDCATLPAWPPRTAADQAGVGRVGGMDVGGGMTDRFGSLVRSTLLGPAPWLQHGRRPARTACGFAANGAGVFGVRSRAGISRFFCLCLSTLAGEDSMVWRSRLRRRDTSRITSSVPAGFHPSSSCRLLACSCGPFHEMKPGSRACQRSGRPSGLIGLETGSGHSVGNSEDG